LQGIGDKLTSLREGSSLLTGWSMAFSKDVEVLARDRYISRH